ncbi:hypothetical protein JCM5296_003681 [Sporobolomyces johnsonii]
MTSFTPRYDQPVTLRDLSQLEPELLSAEIARLQNSIAHLRRSNDELRAFLQQEGDDEGLDQETRKEFEDCVGENEETILRQTERIEMLRLALEAQVGVSAANPHYDALSSSSSAPRPPAPSSPSGASTLTAPPEGSGRSMEAPAAPGTEGREAGGVNGAGGGAGENGMYL